MNLPQTLTDQSQDGLSALHLRLVARVTLITTLSAAVVLVFLLLLVSEEGQGSYLQIIQAHTLTRQHLGTYMLFAALVLMILLGSGVWLIALYTSFRIAGPMYRLDQNLLAALHGESLQGIRHNDSLQSVAHDLQQGVNDINEHYAQLHARLDELAARLAENDNVGFRAELAELKRIESAVQLDD